MAQRLNTPHYLAVSSWASPVINSFTLFMAFRREHLPSATELYDDEPLVGGFNSSC